MQAFLRTVIAIVSLLSATSLVAQNVGISARIEPGEIQIGEQALIRLKIRTNDLDNTFLIVPPDTALHRAEALAFRVVDTVHLTESLKELSAEMVVTSFDSTLVALPAFGVRVGNEEVYTKEPLYLKVNLPEVDIEHLEEFFGLKGAWERDYTLHDIWILARPWVLALGGLLFLSILFLLYRYYQGRLARRKELSGPKDERTLLERFHADMDALHTRQLPQKGLVEEYYTALDMLLRSYLYSLLSINSLEMTSQQLVHSLQKEGYTALLQKEEMLQFMRNSDWAKFANVAIGSEECAQDFNRIVRFIESIHCQQETKEVQGGEEKTERRSEA